MIQDAGGRAALRHPAIIALANQQGVEWHGNVQDTNFRTEGKVSKQGQQCQQTAQPAVSATARGPGMQLVCHNSLFLLFHPGETQILTLGAELLGQVHTFTLLCRVF